MSHTLASIGSRLAEVFRSIHHLHRKVDQLMADVTSIKQLVSDLNDETNAIAAKVDAQQKKIDDLSAQIAAGTPATQADLDAISDGLSPISDRLKALGANPAKPIPPAV
jgi:peptidoglycan hydrolase CwlO-like protein